MNSGMKTPGVYVAQKSEPARRVVEVATAVPAFVGYTRKADHGGNTLTGRPFRITTIAEFERHFGGPPDWRFALDHKRITPAGAAPPENPGSD